MKVRKHALAFLFLLTMVAAMAVQNNRSTADAGNFVTLKQRDGSDVRIFVAGPTDAQDAVLVVHDYLDISDATKEVVVHLGTLGYQQLQLRRPPSDFAKPT